MKKIMTTIEITDADIKLLQIEKVRGKCVVIFCDTRPVVHSSDEEIASLLKEMISSLPVMPDEVTLLVPRRLVILRQMRLPSHNNDEIGDMIGLQLVNNIPYPVDEIVCQHHLIDQDDEGYSRVLAVIIHREISRRYCQLLQKAGIRDGKLVLTSLGILDWVAHYEGKQKEADNQSVVLLNVDLQHCEMCFCHNKKLFFSRSLPFGSERLASGDTDELVKQIRLSLETYQRGHLGPEARKILIVSAPRGGTALKEKLEKGLGILVESLEPLDDASCLQGIDKAALRARYSSSITAGLGLLLSNTKNLINLAPGEVHAAKQVRTKRRQFIKFVFLFFLAAALGISGQLIGTHKKGAQLKSLENEIGRLQPQLKEARRKAQFVESFDRKLGQYSFIPDVIDGLNRLTPEEISFRTLSLDNQRRLIIQGYAKTNAGINDFQARLIQSTRFHNVDLKFVTKRKIANMSVMDFKIAFQLNDDNEGAL